MKKRILLLEDEIGNQRLMSFILASEFQVDVVENGHEAFLWLEQNQSPDLIIMDWIMPVIDGKAFLTTFKTHDRHHGIPIIVLSSYEGIHEELESIPYEAHAKLAKPVDPRILKEAISQAIISTD